MKALIAYLSTFLCLLSLQAQSIVENDRFQDLDKEIEGIIDEYHAAGLAIAIIEGEETVYMKGFGYRDFENKLAVDANTIFGIGSVTKAFTASILGILQDQGKLSLRDKPSDYIPELRFYNSQMDDAIKIRNLLCHNTGLPGLSSGSTSILFLPQTKDELIPKIRHLPPTAAVGESFIYNNMLYSVAGLISERVTNQSWGENLSELILRPLEMNHTLTDRESLRNHPDFSYGYAVRDDKPIKAMMEEIPTRDPAGYIFSSISDMTHWVKAWLYEGKYQGTQILPADYVREAISPQQIMQGGPRPGDSDTSFFVHYGYGWACSDFQGFYRVDHSGAISGYTSNITFFPAEDIGIIVLTNQTNTNLPYTINDIIINRVILKQKEKNTYEPAYGISQTPDLETTPTTLDPEHKPSHSLQEMTGKFSHPGFGEIEVVVKENTLLAVFPFTTFRLVHQSYNSFTTQFTEEIPMLMGPFVRLNFVSDFEGRVSSVFINLEEEPVEFKRVVD